MKFDNEFRVLVFAHRAPKDRIEITPTTVSQHTGATYGAVVRLIGEMVKKGLLTKKVGKNKRKRILTLTDKGARLAQHCYDLNSCLLEYF